MAKSRLFLGRTKGAGSAGPPDQTSALCQLELIDGWWHIEDLHCPQGLKVNGYPCKRMRLNSDDEIGIGRHRYRIAYDAPKFPLGRFRSGAPAATPTKAVSAKTELFRKQLAAQAAGVLARLIPSGGGEDIPIRKPRVTIGRRPPCDIVLKHATISSRHCELGLENGYWRAEDLG